MFGGVADGAVALQSGPARHGGPQSRPATWPATRCGWRRAGGGRPAYAAYSTAGAANSICDPGVGQMVLDRLEAADGPAELAALLRVRDRQVQHGAAQPQQLGRRAEHSPIEGRGHGLGIVGDQPACRSRRHEPALPGSIDGLDRLDVDLAGLVQAQLTAGAQQEGLGERSRGNDAVGAAEAGCGRGIGRGCGAEVGGHRAADHAQGRGHQRGGGERMGQAPPCLPPPPPAPGRSRRGPGRRRRPAPAWPVHLRQPGPAKGSGPAPAPRPPSPPRPGTSRRAGPRAVERSALPVVVEPEPHRGRPRTRSATMLRCTSLVPA